MINALHLAAAAALLFGPQTPEKERQHKLYPLFSPQPNTTLELDRLSFLENRKEAQTIKGDIWVRPPKGHCLIIRTNLGKRDQRICKATPVSWRIDDLDALGHLKMQVLIEAEWDDGITLSWNTPYRIGNFTAAGEKDSGNYHDIVINSCKASEIEGERSILLESFEGRRWRLTLPEFDTPIRPNEAPIPNLLVNIDSKKNADGSAVATKEGAAEGKKEEEAKDEHGEKKDDKKAKAGGGSVLGKMLSGSYKDEINQVITFTLPARGAYQMESGLFTETGSPKGMNGTCRYMFKNAPGDPDSGAIECHDTDTLDNVYVHVTCFSQLKIRPAPTKSSDGKGNKK